MHTLKDKAAQFTGFVMAGAMFAYFAIGVAHGWYFWATVGRSACNEAKAGFIYWYCHVGFDIAWLISVVGWPLYWLT
jgi:hypothetical protein